ncbi:uncharacterized protein G2W53_018373 [Senna tora]|uniref:Uncharacterized protein n=1 Tax=Senna tora TaxID=362788 RepID=A0A834WRJ7_9FABA|nr:uncharacterized protein G2W53_018373 [Senna tora]
MNGSVKKFLVEYDKREEIETTQSGKGIKASKMKSWRLHCKVN